MIKWQDVTQGTESLEEVLKEVTLILTPQQFVVMNEIISEYTGSKSCDPRIYEILKSIQFDFVKKGE
jgi:hypothetical protein